MKVSYLWLQDYFEEKLPSPEKIGEILTMHAFEVESIEEKGNDKVLDIKVLPDRSHDCLSHRGIAQEIAVLTDLKIKEGVVKDNNLNIPESNILKVEVGDSKLCRRFSAIAIDNIEVKDSPKWLRERMETIGQRSINNIVDATNYVMFSLGQPLHAYDRDLLKDSDGDLKIVVRGAREGESLLALDDKEYSLLDGELVITNGLNGAVLGIAGIKGGKTSEISLSTKNIILEAANFESINIRQISKRLGLRTDASIRFENEITPELTTMALRQVLDLILDIASSSNTQVEGLVDLYPNRASLYKVGVSLSEIQKTLGLDISQKEVEDILIRTRFKFEMVNDLRKSFLNQALSLAGTEYKFGASVLKDSPKRFDCSGLVAYSAMNVGIALPRMSIDQFVFCEDVSKESFEAGDLIFVMTKGREDEAHKESKEWMKGTPVLGGIDHVGIMVSKDQVFHTSRYNPDGARQESLEDFLKIRDLRGFRKIPTIDDGSRFVVTIPAERIDLRIKEDLIEEIGRIYGYQNLVSKSVAISDTTPQLKERYYERVIINFFTGRGFSQIFNYAFRSEGEIELENPLAQDKKFLRKDLSAGLSNSLAFNLRNKDLLGLAQVKLFEIGKVFSSSGEHISLAFTLESLKGGESSDNIKKDLDDLLGVNIAFEANNRVFEVNLSDVISKLPEAKEDIVSVDLSDRRFKPYSQYPFIIRDIAVFVPENEDGQKIIDIVTAEARELLINHRLFDVFTKDFPEGKKTSYAYRFVFQSYVKTLTDDEINKIMDKVANQLNSKEGWEVR